MKRFLLLSTCFLLFFSLSVGCKGLLTDFCFLAGGFNETFERGAKIWLGNFYLDENAGVWEGAAKGALRRTWEGPQSTLGYSWSMLKNFFGNVTRVDYLGGATFVTAENSQDGNQGVTIGDFINIDLTGRIRGDFQTYVTSHPLYMHEYGHTIDSRKWGPLYLLGVGLPSAISASQNIDISNPQYPDAFIGSHDLKPYEKAANRNAKDYFGRHYDVDWSKHEPHYPL